MPTSEAGSSANHANRAACGRPVADWSSRRARSKTRGFTLIELMVVVTIIALASAGVGFALRDSSQTRLAREGDRLAALLEAARAQSRSTGVAIVWRASAAGFRFDGAAPDAFPDRWLDADTRVSQAGDPAGTLPLLNLGPEPLIGPQAVLLVSAGHPHQAVRVATDGLRPFTVQPIANP